MMNTWSNPKSSMAFRIDGVRRGVSERLHSTPHKFATYSQYQINFRSLVGGPKKGFIMPFCPKHLFYDKPLP
jgi:hypothetical protein